MKTSIKVIGQTSLIQHVWVGEIGDGVIIHLDTWEKHPEYHLTSNGPDRVIVLHDAGLDCEVHISIENQESWKLEMWDASESRYQIRMILMPVIAKQTMQHVWGKLPPTS